MPAKLTGNKMILGAVVGIAGGLIVAVLLVVVMGVGRSSSPTAAAAAGASAATKPTTKAPLASAGAADARFGPTYVIKDRIVNLADPGGRRYLRFSVTIQFEPTDPQASLPGGAAREGGFQLALYVPELDAASTRGQLVTGGKADDPDKAFQGQIRPYTAAIEDAVTSVLSAKTYDEVRGPDGKEHAKREIKDRVQRIVGDRFRVADVFLTDFVVQ
jgi:flagellar basal body-associated protein FliL